MFPWSFCRVLAAPAFPRGPATFSLIGWFCAVFPGNAGLAEDYGILRSDWLSRGYRIPGECGTLAEESGPCFLGLAGLGSFWLWVSGCSSFGLVDDQACSEQALLLVLCVYVCGSIPTRT